MITEIWSMDDKRGPALLARDVSCYPFTVGQEIKFSRDVIVKRVDLLIGGDGILLQSVFVSEYD